VQRSSVKAEGNRENAHDERKHCVDYIERALLIKESERENERL
jgi:hypothetical protein